MNCPHCNAELSPAFLAGALGSITSAKKKVSSRENGKQGYTKAMREAKRAAARHA